MSLRKMTAVAMTLGLMASVAQAQLDSPVISAGGLAQGDLLVVIGQSVIGYSVAGTDEAQLGAVPCWAAPGDCPGDTDGDGQVTISDLGVLLANFGMTSGATPADGDVDLDGDVDVSDLGLMLSVFGTTCT